MTAPSSRPTPFWQPRPLALAPAATHNFANGAVLVTADGAWHATPPPTHVVSTVGAGDSSLFGYILGDIRGLAAPDRLALAVAYGSAAAGLPGTTIPEPAHLRTDLVRITVLGGSA